MRCCEVTEKNCLIYHEYNWSARYGLQCKYNYYIYQARAKARAKGGGEKYENNIYFFLQFNDQKILKETIQDAIQSRLWWALKIMRRLKIQDYCGRSSFNMTVLCDADVIHWRNEYLTEYSHSKHTHRTRGEEAMILMLCPAHINVMRVSFKFIPMAQVMVE